MGCFEIKSSIEPEYFFKVWRNSRNQDLGQLYTFLPRDLRMFEIWSIRVVESILYSIPVE